MLPDRKAELKASPICIMNVFVSTRIDYQIVFNKTYVGRMKLGWIGNLLFLWTIKHLLLAITKIGHDINTNCFD